MDHPRGDHHAHAWPNRHPLAVEFQGPILVAAEDVVGLRQATVEMRLGLGTDFRAMDRAGELNRVHQRPTRGPAWTGNRGNAVEVDKDPTGGGHGVSTYPKPIAAFPRLPNMSPGRAWGDRTDARSANRKKKELEIAAFSVSESSVFLRAYPERSLFLWEMQRVRANEHQDRPEKPVAISAALTPGPSPASGRGEVVGKLINIRLSQHKDGCREQPIGIVAEAICRCHDRRNAEDRRFAGPRQVVTVHGDCPPRGTFRERLRQVKLGRL
jgi:hypothetical protein